MAPAAAAPQAAPRRRLGPRPDPRAFAGGPHYRILLPGRADRHGAAGLAWRGREAIEPATWAQRVTTVESGDAESTRAPADRTPSR